MEDSQSPGIVCHWLVLGYLAVSIIGRKAQRPSLTLGMSSPEKHEGTTGRQDWAVVKRLRNISHDRTGGLHRQDVGAEWGLCEASSPRTSRDSRFSPGCEPLGVLLSPKSLCLVANGLLHQP